jgi:hypothetical protein
MFQKNLSTTKHILRMSCGVSVEMIFKEETAQMGLQVDACATLLAQED